MHFSFAKNLDILFVIMLKIKKYQKVIKKIIIYESKYFNKNT